VALLLCFLPVAETVSAQGAQASLFVDPSGGTYSVGSTFSVSVYVNSGENFINAVEANLIFPPDKLQVVSPSVGKSFIDVWVGQPKFSNANGTISFQGAIPSPGAKTSKGLISTITFRVKSTGKAFIKFTDSSKVLLNDGKATDILSDMSGAVFDLVLPPPQGPLVASRTHPDQASWYNSPSAIFDWSGDENAEAYSFVLDQNPVTVPDDVSEGSQAGISYETVPNGINYFHIKTLRAGVWGGTTHFAINVDALPPADFTPDIDPRKQTTQVRPVIHFDTTDAHSGMDHYELKLIPLTVSAENGDTEINQQGFFIEATSPYITELAPGKYDVLIRAYDKAGNFLEKKERIQILPTTFRMFEWLLPVAVFVLPVLIVLLLISIYFANRTRYWHKKVSEKIVKGPLADQEIKEKLQKLKEYQKRYGNIAIVVLLFGLMFGVFASAPAYAMEINPPVMTTYSEDLTNKEPFYIGGKHDLADSQIDIFLQKQDTGETFSFVSKTDQKGDWFYISEEPIHAGEYRVWTQARVDALLSPTSPAIIVSVIPVTLRLGSSILTKETLYLFAVLVLLALFIAVTLYGLHHLREAKKKEKAIEREVMEAQQSIKLGFAILKRDIQAQIHASTKKGMSDSIRTEELGMEQKLLEDLAFVESHIGQEILDIKEEIDE